MAAMPTAAFWLLALALVSCAATMLRQWQLLRAARSSERLLQRQLAHTSGFALAGELATAGMHDTGDALEAILQRVGSSQALAARADGALDALQRELVQLSAEALRARECVRRLLALLAPRAEDDGVVDVQVVLDEALRILEPQARQHGMELVLQAGGHDARVRGDRLQLQVVLLQLLANALDAMADTPRPHRRVLVCTQEAGGHLEVQVSDRGHGFGARDPEALFAPYYTTKPGHLGLGLAVARRIVEAHQGHIEVRRRAGGGAVFTVSLPRQTGGLQPGRATRPARSPALSAPFTVQA
jgi:signal transduction histidine kinase